MTVDAEEMDAIAGEMARLRPMLEALLERVKEQLDEAKPKLELVKDDG